MSAYLRGQRVRLRSNKTGKIEKVLQDDSLAMNVFYRVALEPGGPSMLINGLDVMEALTPAAPPTLDEYFARQRFIARKTLGSGAAKVDEFKKHMEVGHENVNARPGITAKLVHEERRAPSNPNASVVFTGFKTVPAEVVGAIQKFGITPQKYLSLAPKVSADYIEQKILDEKSCAYGNDFRQRFRLDREQKHTPSGDGIDEFKLLQLANAHKSGPGVYTSGFHSTSGKPSYASEYADASGQVIGKAYYNLGAAIEITDECYPLVIQEAIDHWNDLSDVNRYGQPKIEMAFTKEEKSWKRDYESEILLGGATLPTDFVYLCLWKVVRTSVGIMGALGAQLKQRTEVK